jgi:hypothetical protein
MLLAVKRHGNVRTFEQLSHALQGSGPFLLYFVGDELGHFFRFARREATRCDTERSTKSSARIKLQVILRAKTPCYSRITIPSESADEAKASMRRDFTRKQPPSRIH